MKALTDLEYTVLGIVGKKQPCTAYQIMQEFASSTATYYRSRAGSIYPLVRRLVRRGYLKSRAAARGRQARRLYELTAAGRAGLRTWLGAGSTRADAGLPPDLLRTRVYFLALVTPARRRAFLKAALEGVGAELAANQAALAEYRRRGDPFSALAMEGAILAMKARREWLRRAMHLVAAGRGAK